MRSAGTNAHRVDGIEKVTRQGGLHERYPTPGHGACAHTQKSGGARKLVKVDASKAKAFPGVIATLTRDDIQAFNYKYGATYKDQSIVAVDKVRYVGDPVAAVLADDSGDRRSGAGADRSRIRRARRK